MLEPDGHDDAELTQLTLATLRREERRLEASIAFHGDLFGLDVHALV
eukprot:COSAG01_NODE_7635_length_3119_cov_1.967550_3_plen_47_part_00